MRTIAFGSKIYALKHGTIKNAIANNNISSLYQVINLREANQIVSYKPQINQGVHTLESSQSYNAIK